MPTNDDLTWTTIGNVQPGDQIPFSRFGVPSGRDMDFFRAAEKTWRTVEFVATEGRTRILSFTDGTTFEAGHAYRLWVSRNV